MKKRLNGIASPRYDLQDVKAAAAGRAVEILTAVAGIPRELLDGRHHPCPHPACSDRGGTDRFRLIDVDAGAVYCNQCFSSKNGDFLAAIQWFCGCSFKEALIMVAEYLGLDGAATKPRRAPNGLRFVEWDEGAAHGWCAIKPPIVPEALRAIGTRQAVHRGRYPVLAFPIRRSDGDEPLGYAMVDQRGGLLPTFDREGTKTGDAKIKNSVGAKPGWIGPMDRLRDANVVWKLEGPSDVMALLSSTLPDGHVAITNAMGANEKPRPELLRMLAGKEVILVHDADVPGEKGAARWQTGLLTVAAPLKRIQLPYPIEEKHGKDVRDFLFEHGAEGVAKLLELARVVEPEASDVLRNYRKEESPDGASIFIGLEAAEIVEDLQRLGGRDLRAADIGPSGMLFAHRPGEHVSTLERLPDADSLFAWISRTTRRPADWARRSNCLTKAEFLKSAPRLVPAHSWLESAPQWPAIPGVYYARGAIEPEENGWLDELVDVFYFDYDLDRCFAKAAFLTPFLGVYGEKPLGYVTSPDGQGAGKTQFVESIGYLVGEPIVKFTGGLPREKEREEAFTNPYGVDVGKQAASLIDAHRDELLRDVAAFFVGQPVELVRNTRWTTWTNEIVARFDERADAMVDRLLDDQREVDGDAQVGEEIEAAVLEALADRKLDPRIARVHVSHTFLGRVLGLPADAPIDRRRITSAIRASLMGRNTDDGGFRLGDDGTLRLDKSRTASENGRSSMAAGWFYVGIDFVRPSADFPRLSRGPRPVGRTRSDDRTWSDGRAPRRFNESRTPWGIADGFCQRYLRPASKFHPAIPMTARRRVCMRYWRGLAVTVVAGLSVGTAHAVDPAFEILEGIVPNETFMTATDVSADGSAIIGTATGEEDSPVIYRWTDGGGAKKVANAFGFSLDLARLSPDGTKMVGTARDEFPGQPYRWSTNNGFKKLAAATDSDFATCGSADGRISIGGGYDRDTFQNYVVVWNGNEPKRFSIGADDPYQPVDCSDDGKIVAGYRAILGDDSFYTNRPYFWSAQGGFAAIGEWDDDQQASVNSCSDDARVVVGDVSVGDLYEDTRGWAWTKTDGVRILLPPEGTPEPYVTFANDCSDDGSIVVGAVYPSGEPEPGDDSPYGACVWMDGQPYFLAGLAKKAGLELGEDVRLGSADACSADGTVIVGSAGMPEGENFVNLAFRLELPNLGIDPVLKQERPYGAAANAYALFAYQCSIYAFYEPGGYSQSGVDAYTYAMYGYVYSLYAGDTVAWGGEKGTTKSEAMGEYIQYRYYQYVYDYYAQINAEQRYYASPGDYSLYSYYFALLATAYGSYDLGG